MDKTEIMIILDESPSMAGSRDATIKGYNTFLGDQKKEPKPATMSLIKFNENYKIIFVNKPLTEVPELNLDTYVPGSSGTALFDAVGRGVFELGERLRLMPEAERPDKIIVVIITDGEENASREFSLGRVKDMIKLQTETYGWTFVFMGTDIDAYKGGQMLGITTSNIAQYSRGNTGDAYKGLSQATSRSRGADAGSLRSHGMFNDQDKALIENPKKK